MGKQSPGKVLDGNKRGILGVRYLNIVFSRFVTCNTRLLDRSFALVVTQKSHYSNKVVIIKISSGMQRESAVPNCCVSVVDICFLSSSTCFRQLM